MTEADTATQSEEAESPGGGAGKGKARQDGCLLFLRDYSVTILLFLVACLFAGAVTEIVGDHEPIYLLSFSVGLVPVGLWLRRCGAASFDRFDLVLIVIVIAGLYLWDLYGPVGNRQHASRFVVVLALFHFGDAVRARLLRARHLPAKEVE